jgi:hypothetical protein
LALPCTLSVSVFLCAVGVGLPDPAVRVFSNPRSIWEVDILLAVGELNGFNPVLFNSLDRPVWEDALLLTICENTLYRAIGESKLNKVGFYLHDFLGAVGKVLFNLVVGELEHLKAI